MKEKAGDDHTDVSADMYHMPVCHVCDRFSCEGGYHGTKYWHTVHHGPGTQKAAGGRWDLKMKYTLMNDFLAKYGLKKDEMIESQTIMLVAKEDEL